MGVRSRTKTRGVRCFRRGMVVMCVCAATAAQAQETGTYRAWHWDVGLEERLRAEYVRDFDLNDMVNDNGGQFYHRLRLHTSATLTDEYLNEQVTVLVEGLDAQTAGYRKKAPAAQRDDFDLHQAYVQLFHLFGSALTCNAGRMELKYGAGRLVAAPTWANLIRSFDGAVITVKEDEKWIDVLYGRRVINDDNNFNESSADEFLAGCYGGYQRNRVSTLYEGYVLAQVIDAGTTDIERYTAGVRLKGILPLALGWEAEVPFQFGQNGSRDIRAYAFSLSLNKRWAAAWEPVLGIEYNLASGDTDPTDGTVTTFVPLYQSTHAPYGLMDFFRWQNMREVAAKLSLSVTDTLKITPQVNFFRLDNTHDAWYKANGSVMRSNAAVDNSYVGSEASLSAQYRIGKNITWESGYAHFFAGEYVRESGTHDDADWFFSQITLNH